MNLLPAEPESQYPSASRWYALHVRSRFEKRTHSELRRHGFESFLPLIEEIRMWSDRRKRVEEPMFRGYIFVHTNLRDKIPILQTEGVVRFVGIRNTPSAIPDEEINWVRILTKSPDAIRREDQFEAGEWVRVHSGPFQGVCGFVTMMRGRAKVVVCVPSIAQAVSIDVPAEFVERIAKAS